MNKTTEKSNLPRLPNGDIDFSKIDIHSDFGLFPPLFQSADDIEKFIKAQKIEVPILQRFLFLAKLNRLDLTPTETKFYFDEFFDYIYDVYRIPMPETYIETEKWIANYLEGRLIARGLQGLIEDAFKNRVNYYHQSFHVSSVLMEEVKGFDLNTKLPIINCHELNIKKDFYNRPNAIESFWIKSDLHSIQPLCIGDEAYARVHVFKNKVYIYGCDDCSWTLSTSNKKTLTDFVHKLKRCCPVWNFKYPKYIHDNLEFTN